MDVNKDCGKHTKLIKRMHSKFAEEINVLCLQQQRLLYFIYSVPKRTFLCTVMSSMLNAACEMCGS